LDVSFALLKIFLDHAMSKKLVMKLLVTLSINVSLMRPLLFLDLLGCEHLLLI
jgi:hypothetical protein